MDNTMNSKEEIQDKIKELQNKLHEFEKMEKNIQNIQVGDYILYYQDSWKIAEICIDDDGMYRIYYPQFKEISCHTHSSMEDLYETWLDDDNTIKYIPIKKDRVNYLEIDKKYFVFKKFSFENSRNWNMIRLDIEEEPIIAYDIETELMIAQGKNIDELLAMLLNQYDYIAEIRDEELERKYTLLDDDSFLQDLGYHLTTNYFDGMYYYVKFKDHELIDIASNVIRYCNLSKEDLINITIRNFILDEKNSSIIKPTINSFIESTKKYFFNSRPEGEKWFPFDLGLDFYDYFPSKYDEFDEPSYQLIEVNNKYALYNTKTRQLHPKIYSSVKDIVDDIHDCGCYEEIIILCSSKY